jgi:Bacterial SH3 domain
MPSHAVTTVFARWLVVLGFVVTAGCADLFPGTKKDVPEPVPAPEVKDTASDARVRRDQDRIRALEREVERLKADLNRAENTLVSVESGLRAGHTRADAVSALAEAHIQLNKATRLAPWRTDAIKEAGEKLDLARQNIDSGRFGAAVFFVYRANRIIEELQYESEMIKEHEGVFFINAAQVNIREGPSTDHTILSVLTSGTPVIQVERKDKWVLVRTTAGLVGWVHVSLLDRKQPAPGESKQN